MLDLWYKNAVIYCLDVETFMDADGNGQVDLAEFQRVSSLWSPLWSPCWAADPRW